MEQVVATRKSLELCPQEALDRQWPCPLATRLSSEPAPPPARGLCTSVHSELTATRKAVRLPPLIYR